MEHGLQLLRSCSHHVRASCLLLALWVLQASAVESQQRLHVDKNGRLSAASSAEASPRWRTHQALFPVKLNFDLSELSGERGLTMVFDKGSQALRVNNGMVPGGGVAWGKFSDNIEKSGWSELHLMTTDDENTANDVKTYAAGYMEGLMTSVRISEFYANSQKLLLRKDKSANALSAIREFFNKQLTFARSMTNMEHYIFSQEPEDPYWKHVRYTFFQMWGVLDGYNAAALRFGGDTLELEDIVFMNAGGELPQLMEAFASDARVHRAARTQAPSFLQRTSLRTKPPAMQEDPLDDAHWMKRVAESGRCSALVRLAEGDRDLLMGHTTWDDYSKMTRIFKFYNFSMPAAETSATRIAFSSYPGAVTSTDDFYVMSSGITTMETSLEILDPTVWDKVHDFPRFASIPNFMHLMAVNRMAKSSAHWAKLFSKANTGTFTSQWMVTDYNEFKRGEPIPDSTFWVIEMIPGVSEMRDMSGYLREKRYWPSFNRPFFATTREASGFSAAERTHGMLYSYEANPRATIFLQGAPAVNDLAEMRTLMNRNQYPLSSVANNDPGHEISARYDLSPALKIPNGGIDAKVVSRCLVKQLQVQAVSGPSHQSLQPFRWKGPEGDEIWPDYPHAGMPDEWNFDYVQMAEYGEAQVSDIEDC